MHCEAALYVSFQMKTALTLHHLPVAAACWGREGGRSCWPFPQPAHGRKSLQAQPRQSSCILPLQPPCLRDNTKSDPWQKEETPPGSSVFSCTKPGHSSSLASQYLLISQSPSLKSLTINYTKTHLSFETSNRFEPPWKPRHVNCTCT